MSQMIDTILLKKYAWLLGNNFIFTAEYFMDMK